jgi:hypothetical protein
MRTLRLLILLGMFICSSQLVKGQVFGYPGATWVFGTQAWWAVCFGGTEKWEYASDTIILGTSAKNIKVTNKFGSLWPPYVQTSIYHYYFQVSGDTVFKFIPEDSTWFELYNFSLAIGDTTDSPLRNSFAFGFSCDDTVPYLSPAVVTNVGLDTIAGQSLRFYTVKYLDLLWGDTSYSFQTYYERFITTNFWYPDDPYWCTGVQECGIPDFMCYKDNGMMTDSLCSDFTWFETLSIPQQFQENLNISIYPNPTTNILTVQHDPNPLEKYSVIGSDGKIILSNLQSPINTSNMPSGVYIITNEARTWYKKFVKS